MRKSLRGLGSQSHWCWVTRGQRVSSFTSFATCLCYLPRVKHLWRGYVFAYNWKYYVFLQQDLWHLSDTGRTSRNSAGSKLVWLSLPMY